MSGSFDFLNQALDDLYASRHDFGALHILNTSLGGAIHFNDFCDTTYPSTSHIVGKFLDAGIPMFAASGNESSYTGILSPACLQPTFAVGATYDESNVSNLCHSGDNLDEVTCYSNSGFPLHILAPGSVIRSTDSGGGYSSGEGTSFAAPYAAGVTAQIYSLRPSTTITELFDALTLSGKPILDPRNGITRSRIDALAAYEYLEGGSDAPPPTECTEDLDNGVICLFDERFIFEMEWTDFQDNTKPVVFTQETGKVGLGFFGDLNNVTVVVKVTNGCPLNGYYWIWVGGFTNAGWSLTVTDTVTGITKSYPKGVGSGLPTTVKDDSTFTCD